MTKQERQFVDTVWQYYKTHGRHDLPWRQTSDPYRIVVSEVMLQQTQVVRVKVKYKEFLRRFASTKQLAQVPLSEVLITWQGLGYNRRAKLLQQAAQAVHTKRNGRWPRTYDGLCALPGIGSYTAGAVMAFAYNQPVPIIETNIRTVFLHHFFRAQTNVTDVDIQRQVERTLASDQPRQWYWALMDYGSFLKATVGSQNQRSKQYQKQSPFKGSVREVRGAIVRCLGERGPLTQQALQSTLSAFPWTRVATALDSLVKDNLVVKETVGQRYSLPV